MNSRRITAILVVLLGLAWLALPAVAQDSCQAPTPVVDPDSGLPFGVVEAIGQGNAVSGVVAIRGWFLSINGIQRVDVFVDGTLLGSAPTNRGRPDIFALYPSFPNAAFAGFAILINTTKFNNGVHTISARGVDTTGAEGEASSSLTVQFSNTVHNLRPFGRLTTPRPNAELYGSCDPNASPRRLDVVNGWALDAGIEFNDHGVGYVELLLDGSILYNSRRDCHTDAVAGRYTQCYGLPDLTVQRQFPGLKDSPNAGFRFVMDIGALILGGYAEGSHVLTIRVGDQDSQVANIASVNVDFLCDIGADRGSFGQIDPFTDSAEFVAGIVQVSGFALDFNGVNRIVLTVDGRNQPNPTYGIARSDALLQYPGFPDSATAGFVGNIDTTLLGNGVHHFSIFVIDKRGDSTLLGKVAFQVRNP